MLRIKRTFALLMMGFVLSNFCFADELKSPLLIRNQEIMIFQPISEIEKKQGIPDEKKDRVLDIPMHEHRVYTLSYDGIELSYIEDENPTLDKIRISRESKNYSLMDVVIGETTMDEVKELCNKDWVLHKQKNGIFVIEHYLKEFTHYAQTVVVCFAFRDEVCSEIVIKNDFIMF